MLFREVPSLGIEIMYLHLIRINTAVITAAPVDDSAAPVNLALRAGADATLGAGFSGVFWLA
jgi:hypothetical protein